MTTIDPPSYSIEDDVGDQTQLIIVPIHDDFAFQTGYLGADGEHAAVEGEVQIKSAAAGDGNGNSTNIWERVVVSLVTIETTPSGTVELSRTTRELWTHATTTTSTTTATPPSILPFSLPLMADAPQCIHTPFTSLEHSLTATLHGGDGRVLCKTVAVHTHRYASASTELPTAPETRAVEVPTRVEAQIPRTAWRAGEPIPVYVTVPPPSASTVLMEGIRLRSVRAELLQIVRVPGVMDNGDSTWAHNDDEGLEEEQAPPSDDDTDDDDEADDDSSSSSDAASLPVKEELEQDDEDENDAGGAQFATVVAHSGAPCHFHRSKAIKIRLVLHPPAPSIECARGITQRAVLHDVRFRLRVRATFTLLTGRRERTVRLLFPLIMLPPPPPPHEPEGDAQAYRKKHDAPPTRTVRRSDAVETETIPEPGPSDPPPPFFDPLPTFEAALTADASGVDLDEPAPALFEGEGTLFGFPVDEQYDGLSLPGRESGLPPDFAELLASRAQDPPPDFSERPPPGAHAAPPPPPPMDDPSDPPPAIDTPFAGSGPPPYLTRQNATANAVAAAAAAASGGPPPYVEHQH